jgi:hypothetical protein
MQRDVDAPHTEQRKLALRQQWTFVNHATELRCSTNNNYDYRPAISESRAIYGRDRGDGLVRARRAGG